jgi:hypothetical protein
VEAGSPSCREPSDFRQDIEVATNFPYAYQEDVSLVRAGIASRLAEGVESFISFLGDFFSSPPPPTKDQAERMERVADEKAEARADIAAEKGEHGSR